MSIAHRSRTGAFLLPLFIGLLAISPVLAPTAAQAVPVDDAGSVTGLYPGTWDPAGYCMDPPTNANTGHVGRCSGQYIWTDAASDQRLDGDDPDSNYDLSRLRITADTTNVYFLLTFGDITDAGRPYVGIAVDTIPGGGQNWLGDLSETQVSGAAGWEREIVANVNKTGIYDPAWNWSSTGSSSISAADNTVEIAMPWSALGVAAPARLRFTVMVAQNDNGGTRDVGASDALDAVTWTGGNTWNEVGDGVIDYYFDAWFNAAGEVYSPLLITAVLVNGLGSPECEWVRLTNVAGVSLPLNNYKIGDEETKGSTEGMEMFGDVTIGGGSILVATDWAKCACSFAPDFEVATMTNYSAWASGSFALSNSSDEVLLLDDRDTVLDVVTLGSGSYPGVSAHTIPAESSWLERWPNDLDTNNCAIDFVERSTGPCPPQPTLVELASFTATATPAGIHVAWETASEIDNAGFNLYRSDSLEGQYARLNAALIPAQGGPTQGAGYAYEDTDVTLGVTYWYKLEDVDVYGRSTLHGPVHATAGAWRHVYLPLVVR